MGGLIVANIRQRPIRSLVSVAGVALGVALVMLFTGLARGMSNELQRRSLNIRAEIIFSRPGSQQLLSSSANLSTAYVDLLKKVDGVAAAVPQILNMYQNDRGFGFEQIGGVDWDEFAAMNDIHLVEGRPARAVDEIVIDVTKARNDNLKVGSLLKIFGAKPYRITGIYSPESGARVKMSLSAMQDALEAPNKCTYILVKCKEGYDSVQVAKNISAQLPGNHVQFTKDWFMSVEKSIPFLGVFLRVLVGLSAFVSAMVVMLAMYTTITERTREIGILKALGASRGYIIGVIEREAVLISTLGLVAGFTVSALAGEMIHRAFDLTFEYGWSWALTAAAIGLAGGALGALYPAVRAAGLDAVNALSYD